MNLEYKHSEEDIVNAMLTIKEEKEGFKKVIDKLHKVRSRAMVGLLLIIAILTSVGQVLAGVPLRVINPATVALGLCTIYMILGTKYKGENDFVIELSSLIKKRRNLLGDTTLQVLEGKLIFKRSDKSVTVPLENVQDILDDGNMVYIEAKGLGDIIMVPSSVFESDAHKEEFISLIDKSEKSCYRKIASCVRYPENIITRNSKLYMGVLLIAIFVATRYIVLLAGV